MFFFSVFFFLFQLRLLFYNFGESFCFWFGFMFFFFKSTAHNVDKDTTKKSNHFSKRLNVRMYEVLTDKFTCVHVHNAFKVGVLFVWFHLQLFYNHPSHFEGISFFFSRWCLGWCKKSLETAFGPLKPGCPCQLGSTAVSRWWMPNQSTGRLRCAAI